MEEAGSSDTKAIQKKLTERAEAPHNPASLLRGFQNVHKIKLRSVGYRLVYEVNDGEIVIIVIAAGKRERAGVCKSRRTPIGITIYSYLEFKPRLEGLSISASRV